MSDEAPCRYCGHWDVPNDEKMYCLKHYRRTFHDKGCDICELEAEVTLLSERFNGANGRLEDMTNKRNALDIVIAGLKAQVAELEQKLALCELDCMEKAQRLEG